MVLVKRLRIALSTKRRIRKSKELFAEKLESNAAATIKLLRH